MGTQWPASVLTDAFLRLETVDLVVLCFSLLNKASLEATLFWAELIIAVDKTFTPIVLVSIPPRVGSVACPPQVLW